MKLDKEINYIKASELLNEVRLSLNIYYEKGLIDDNIMYPAIQHCLGEMGIRIHPQTQANIIIDNFVGILPYDFRKLEYALACFDYTVKTTDDRGSLQVYEQPDLSRTEYYVHPEPKNSILEPNDFRMIQKFDTFTVTLNSFSPLSIDSSSYNVCSPNCLNKRSTSPNKINIDRGAKKVFTNFETGYIYMEYMQDLILDTEEGLELLIPDFSQVRKWVKDYCIMETFRYIYNNHPEVDVMGRLKTAEQVNHISQTNALSFVSRSDVKELFEFRNLFRQKFRTYAEMVYGHNKYSNIRR